MKRRILLVDDDLAVRLTLKTVLELHGFEVETAGSSGEALARLQSATYHMVISDLRMETDDAGLEVIRAARRQSYAPATALLTAYPPEDVFRKARSREEHPDSMLVKPIGTDALIRQIEVLLIRHADQQQLRERSSASPNLARHRPAS